MSEYVAQNCVTSANNYFKKLNNNNQDYEQNFKLKNEWDEILLEEDISEKNLIQELSETNNYIFTGNDDNNIIFSEVKEKTFKKNQRLNLSGENYHIINDILLIIKKNTFIFDIKELFNSKIDFEMGGQQLNVSGMTLEYNMLLCKLLNKEIVEEDDKIIIPLSQFELLKCNMINQKQFKNFKGFPLAIIRWHQLSANIKLDCSYKFLVKYQTVNDKCYFDKYEKIKFDIPSFCMQNSNAVEQNVDGIIKLYFNHITKFLIIKIRAEDQDLINIQNIYLYLNGREPITYNIYMDEINEVSLFGNNYLVVSFSPNFKNIRDLLSNLQKGNISNYGINLSMIDKVSVKIEDIPNYLTVDISAMSINITIISQGMIGNTFSN